MVKKYSFKVVNLSKIFLKNDQGKKEEKHGRLQFWG